MTGNASDLGFEAPWWQCHSSISLVNCGELRGSDERKLRKTGQKIGHELRVLRMGVRVN